MMFKDIPIEAIFIYQEEKYKKIDFEHAKNLKTKAIFSFFPNTEIDIVIEPNFKLNY